VENNHGPLLGLEPTEPPLQLLAIGDGLGVVVDCRDVVERSHLLRPAPQLSPQVGTGVDHQAVEPCVEPIGIAH